MVPADWVPVFEDCEEEVVAASACFSAAGFAAVFSAGFSAGFCDGAEDGADDLAAAAPIDSRSPGWISDGSEPTASRLSA